MQDSSIESRQVELCVPDWRSGFRDAASGSGASVAGVGPTGVAALDPLVTATAAGRTAFYAGCTPERAARVADELTGETIEDAGDPDAVVEHAPDTMGLPVAELAGIDVGRRRVLAGCGWRRPASPSDHDAAGGFVDAAPDEILATADELVGRGWGDWRRDEPVAPDWRRARAGDDGVAVVVNAHGGPADALLLRSVPFEVLEGAELLARAVGADRVVVYASEADERAVERVRSAADAYLYPDAPVDVVTGPSEYRAGEPTMALEAVEGNHRLEARLRHADELPTLNDATALVHSARTLAHLAVAVRTGERPSTRLVTVEGDVESPATVELPETATLDAALDAVQPTGGVKAACVGGRFGGLTDSFDVRVSPDALADADLGTGGRVEVLAEDRCVVAFAGELAAFAAEENCGRCVPCREGATQLRSLLRDVYDGEYDAAGIEELVRAMETSSVCPFGVDAARPTRTAMAAFGAEFSAHADGRCPSGACSTTEDQR
ncbi:NADH-ubiquinone oxidoreductase-F iron-sulfur binding region domain-containing protein [Halomicrococcus gelatinilyticus]|uniref:NADH-ubiquinone oxidoreductase-F iron-sulfur binding region domain-containing protein n=1 Tax=Halomicrococcus gelatinilyticus TaxID=1702103 RepID=UPI002E10D375